MHNLAALGQAAVNLRVEKFEGGDLESAIDSILKHPDLGDREPIQQVELSVDGDQFLR